MIAHYIEITSGYQRTTNLLRINPVRKLTGHDLRLLKIYAAFPDLRKALSVRFLAGSTNRGESVNSDHGQLPNPLSANGKPSWLALEVRM
jgi:hypothetical protein